MRFVRKTIPWQSIGENVVIVDSQNNQAHELSDVASLVWKQLENEISINQIVETLTTEFEVSADQAEVDTQDLLKELANKGLVESRV